MISFLIKLAEKKLIPDFIIRQGIKILLKKRINSLVSNNPEENIQDKIQFIKEMNLSSIAVVPELANEQHYEIPPEFYNCCLGRYKKYSSCYWSDKTKNLDEAELLSLKHTAKHAKLTNGHNILELGCGWGSLTLWMAKQYPKSKITAVSNSSSQRLHILEQAKKRKAKGWPQAARRSEREAYELKREARNSCGSRRKSVYGAGGAKIGCKSRKRKRR